MRIMSWFRTKQEARQTKVEENKAFKYTQICGCKIKELLLNGDNITDSLIRAEIDKLT